MFDWKQNRVEGESIIRACIIYLRFGQHCCYSSFFARFDFRVSLFFYRFILLLSLLRLARFIPPNRYINNTLVTCIQVIFAAAAAAAADNRCSDVIKFKNIQSTRISFLRTFYIITILIININLHVVSIKSTNLFNRQTASCLMLFRTSVYSITHYLSCTTVLLVYRRNVYDKSPGTALILYRLSRSPNSFIIYFIRYLRAVYEQLQTGQVDNTRCTDTHTIFVVRIYR